MVCLSHSHRQTSGNMLGESQDLLQDYYIHMITISIYSLFLSVGTLLQFVRCKFASGSTGGLEQSWSQLVDSG